MMLDHYHLPDLDEGSYMLTGDFSTLEAAVARAEQIVEQELRDHAAPGMDAAQVIGAWRAWGETPVVITPPGEQRAAWSAQAYAEENAVRYIKAAAD